jgi:hypothetical protein
MDRIRVKPEERSKLNTSPLQISLQEALGEEDDSFKAAVLFSLQGVWSVVVQMSPFTLSETKEVIGKLLGQYH